MIPVSKDAGRKLMRQGWNVYPLEAFGFVLGTANPPCVHAAQIKIQCRCRMYDAGTLSDDATTTIYV